MCNYPRALSHPIESKKELGGQCLGRAVAVRRLIPPKPPQTPRHLYEAVMKDSYK